MSELSGFLNGGINSIQTNFFSTSSVSSSTGEDTTYLDVTITSVDTDKSFILFTGGGSSISTTIAMAESYGGVGESVKLTSRFIDSTTVRFSARQSCTYLVGRWTVVEMK